MKGFSVIRRTIIALMSLSAFLCPAPARAGAGDTSWMPPARFGLFMHYQHRILLGYSSGTAALGTRPKLLPLAAMTAEGWNRFVDEFDAESFAKQMAEARVGWVIFCLDDHYFAWPCAPNKAFDEYTGYAPGERCSRRCVRVSVVLGGACHGTGSAHSGAPGVG